MGLALAYNMDEFMFDIQNIVSLYNQEVRCDEFIPGNEIAVPIIGTGKFNATDAWHSVDRIKNLRNRY